MVRARKFVGGGPRGSLAAFAEFKSDRCRRYWHDRPLVPPLHARTALRSAMPLKPLMAANEEQGWVTTPCTTSVWPLWVLRFLTTPHVWSDPSPSNIRTGSTITSPRQTWLLCRSRRCRAPWEAAPSSHERLPTRRHGSGRSHAAHHGPHRVSQGDSCGGCGDGCGQRVRRPQFPSCL